MKFVKLRQDGCEILVNLSLVSEVYTIAGTNSSKLYLNGTAGEQVVIKVRESLDEIFAKANDGGDWFWKN